ncbi:juvenile hormone acid O-methyltransferase-like [Oculina patagonica]
MSDNKPAADYQRVSASVQRGDGKQLIEKVTPCLGDAILDLGCGTGELSAYLARLVGQEGKVVGVDPDIDRIKVALESHKGVKNLTFVEGSAANFPGMGSETYDIVFANHVLHWISDKEKAFENMFNSLKPNGKIALHFVDRVPSLMDHAFRELNPENLERLLNMYHFKSREVVDEMCIAAGFDIVESYYEKIDREFENCESLCSLLQATTHGAFDPRLATEERLTRFCSQYASKEAATFTICSKGHIRSTLIAAKPAV